MPYPLRIIRKNTTLVYVGGEIRDDDFTGITIMSWNKLDVTNMVDTGVYYFGAGMISPSYVDWEKLHLYRVLEIRKGRSRMPGRSWQVVERWYLHKINIDATIAAYERAVKAGEDPEFYRAPLAHEWRIQ